MISCGAWRALLWARADGDLDEGSLGDLEAHLGGCPACRDESSRVDRIREALALTAAEEPPGGEALARVRAARAARGEGAADRAASVDASPSALPASVGAEGAGPTRVVWPEIMTSRDLAAYLGVGVDAIHEHLGELPAFELGGHIRFRRGAIDDWIRAQEDRWRRQALAASMRKSIASR